jgi:pSer/pThr/pTyr-binding forkhead associated (FHA) protein
MIETLAGKGTIKIMTNSSNPNNAYLVINSQIFHLSKQVTRIGRKLENDLVIQDPQISRSHAEIHKVDDEYTLIDLQSTAGTLIDNQRIAAHKLSSGDLFYLADTPIMFIKENQTLQTGLNKTTGALRSEVK